jgi:arylsulfatase
LKRNGYRTGFVGKWHAPSPPEHMKYTFDYRNMYYGHHWDKVGDTRMHVTDRNQRDAIHFLRNRPDKNQPFALAVSFFATHAWDGQPYPDQYQPMPQSAAWYPNETVIPNPVTNTQQHWEDLPWFFNEKNEGRGRWKNRYDVPERYQVSMKNYYRMASEVDWACGQVIKELKKQGVYNNTLIIFTTDNGVSVVPCCTCVYACVLQSLCHTKDAADGHVISQLITIPLSLYYCILYTIPSIPYHAMLYIVTQLLLS